MRIPLDQGTPVPLRDSLSDHQVSTAYERGWSRLANGDLLDAAERDGFDTLITTDCSLRFQQNLTARRISVIALTTPSWPRIERALNAIVDAVRTASAGADIELTIP